MERFLPNLSEAKLVRWRNVDAVTIAGWTEKCRAGRVANDAGTRANRNARRAHRPCHSSERRRNGHEVEYIYNCA